MALALLIAHAATAHPGRPKASCPAHPIRNPMDMIMKPQAIIGQSSAILFRFSVLEIHQPYGICPRVYVQFWPALHDDKGWQEDYSAVSILLPRAMAA